MDSSDKQDGDSELSLLLSLQDRVLETPPSSPSSSGDESSRPRANVDLSAFKSAVQDCLDYDVQAATKSLKSQTLIDPTLDKYSGLRIRNHSVSPAQLSDRFADIRFVRLSTIKNLIKGDTLSGCWATVGALTEKGTPKTSSTGNTYCIWKIGCLDEQTITVFLFGDAYKIHNKEPPSTAFAFFNARVRNDNSGSGFQLSVFNANQVLKIGTCIDYGVCKGKRKDGLPCTIVTNKRLGTYCSYHRVKASDKYTVTRAELKGGNLRTGFRNQYKPEGVYMVDPLANRSNSLNPKKTTKLLSVEALKKALSNAGKVTTNLHSQGIRCLNEITATVGPKTECFQKNQTNNSSKRSLSREKSELCGSVRDRKRVRTEASKVSGQKTTEKVIELEYISSDEDGVGTDK